MLRTLHAQTRTQRRRILNNGQRALSLNGCQFRSVHALRSQNPSPNLSLCSRISTSNLRRTFSSSAHATSSPIKSIIDHLQSGCIPSSTSRWSHSPRTRSLLSLMHQWLPNVKHRQTAMPLISRLSDILFNSTKTPRGFGQFTKKKTTKKTETTSSEPDAATPKSPESTTPKSTESATPKKESKSTTKTGSSAHCPLRSLCCVSSIRLF